MRPSPDRLTPYDYECWPVFSQDKTIVWTLETVINISPTLNMFRSISFVMPTTTNSMSCCFTLLACGIVSNSRSLGMPSVMSRATFGMFARSPDWPNTCVHVSSRACAVFVVPPIYDSSEMAFWDAEKTDDITQLEEHTIPILTRRYKFIN